MKLPDKFRPPPPSAGIVLERDPSLEGAPYKLDFDDERYEYLLRRDLDFTDKAISELSIKATDNHTIRPRSTGYFNRLTHSIVLKPGFIWRALPYPESATREIALNLRHESKHAAQVLVKGNRLINPDTCERCGCRRCKFGVGGGDTPFNSSVWDRIR